MSETQKLSIEYEAPEDLHSESDPERSPSSTISDSSSTDSVVESASGYTREQKLTALSLAIMNFATQLSFAVIAPFFPVEAEKKGCSPTQVGLIFGIFQLIVFITSPIYGKYINRFGAKKLFLSGSVLCGISNIIFGFLDEMNSSALYVISCFICRTLEANGTSMMTTASFAIMAQKFPHNVGSALGFLKTFSGIGMAVGPTIGGALYSLGGYKLPFIVIGGIVAVVSLLSWKILPTCQDVAVTTSFMKLFRSPGCTIIYLCTVGSSIAFSAFDPILATFLNDNFQLAVGEVGLVFMTAPAVYAVVSPFTGYISDKGWHRAVVVSGCVLNGVAFLLLGPSHLLSSFLPLTLGETIGSLVLLGVGVSFVIVPVFPMVIDMASSRGYVRNLQTYGMISGYLNSASALGAFIGPSEAGYLSEKYDFPWSTTINGFMIIAVGVLFCIYLLSMKAYQLTCLRRKKELHVSGFNEKTTLLGHQRDTNSSAYSIQI